MLQKHCLKCNKLFPKSYTESLSSWENRRKFCSLICANNNLKDKNISTATKNKISVGLKIAYKEGRRISFFKGKEPWSKGKKGIHLSPITEFKKGHKAPLTAFKKQDIRITGSANKLWKGGKVGYGALHSWLRRKLGKATYCKNNSTHKGNFMWANISGKYKRNIEDWHQLCNTCNQIDGIKVPNRFKKGGY